MSRVRPLCVVLSLCLSPLSGWSADPPDFQPLRLQCRGNEPFWSVEVNGDSAISSRLGVEPQEQPFEGSVHTLDYLQPPWLVWRGFNVVDGEAGGEALVMTLRREACHDTMADGPPMDYRAVVVYPDASVVTGCCAAVGAPDSP